MLSGLRTKENINEKRGKLPSRPQDLRKISKVRSHEIVSCGERGFFSTLPRVLCLCLSYLQICCKYLHAGTHVSIFKISNKLPINDPITMMVMILQLSIAESIRGSVNKRRTIVKNKKAVMMMFIRTTVAGS